MKKRLIAHTAVCWLIVAGALIGLGIANAQPIAIAAGTDYLQTASGTQATLPVGGGITVTLHGVPIKSTTRKYGSTDTSIVRPRDAVFSSGNPATNTPPFATVPIIVQELNLEGTVQAASPTGDTCTVHVTLAPTPPSTGTLTLFLTSPPTGGTYTSILNMNVQITFTPVQAGATCYPSIPLAQCAMMQGQNGTAAGTWSIDAVAGEFLVQGPYGDLAANQHTTGLPPGYADFYISQIQTDSAATAVHATCEAYEALHQRCPSSTGDR
jgi:hypothetical protein